MKNYRALTRLGALTLIGAALGAAVLAQPPAGAPFSERARAALAQPFVGLTTDGTPVQGLFPLGATGVSTEPVRLAAERLIASLDAAHRDVLLFPVDDSEWRNWANVHRFPRQGAPLADMTETQREAAFELLRTSLSARGYATARDIMRLNHHLAELVANFDEYGEDLYFFTVMGTPSATEPWGWQIDGHHLVVNYFVLADQVVMTPTFMGSEPISAASGKYAGTSVLDVEQETAVQLMRSLDDAQRAAALIGADKRGRGDNRAEMLSDNVTVALEGISATRLSRPQRELLLDLVGTYVGQMDHGHAAVKMEEVRAHLDATYFAWKGTVADDGVFYYRVQSPVIYIEFDHQGPVALDGPRDVPTRRHVHTVVRTPNGNDYGKDLLRQHYEAHRDDPAHGHSSGAGAP
jgi:hypothetical protein